MIDMQPLPSLPSPADKPRLRAACDACRQSKVRCSGGEVCLRCAKHDFKCTYSIASRAGKPKGSKNKSTLKKLENLQATKELATPRKTATWPVTGLPPDPHVCLRDRRRSHPASTVTRYDLEWPVQKFPETYRKYSTPGKEVVYSPPISPGFKPYSWGGTLSSEPDKYGPVDAPFLSPGYPQFIHSPGEEFADISSRSTEPPTPVEFCDCMQRLALSQSQLDNLGRDPSRWSFESSIDTVASSLSSCQLLFNCAVCSKDTNNVLLAVSELDRQFSVLARIVVQTINQNSTGPRTWGDPYILQNEYVSARRKSLLERTLKSSYEILGVLRGLLDTGIDLHVVNERLEMMDFPVCPDLSFTQQPLENRMLGPFDEMACRNPSQSVEQCPTSLYDVGTPSNCFSSAEISFVRQVICRYDSILERLRASISYNPAAEPVVDSTSTATFGLLAPWAFNLPNACDQQPVQYQPAAQTLPPRASNSFDLIGLS